jgi:hypothetical protein
MASACLGSDNDGLGCVSLFSDHIGNMVLHTTVENGTVLGVRVCRLRSDSYGKS